MIFLTRLIGRQKDVEELKILQSRDKDFGVNTQMKGASKVEAVT